MRALTINGLLTLLLAVVTASMAAAQSLADVARKEEERRKQEPQATKVYTNKDLGPVPSVSTPPPPPSPSTADDGKGKAEKNGDKADKGDDKDKAKKDDVKDQAYWSGRMKTLLETADRDTTLADALQSRINALTTDFINRDDPVQKQQIANDRDRALTELDRLKKQVADDQKAIADFQEEARRAGIPPGWLR